METAAATQERVLGQRAPGGAGGDAGHFSRPEPSVAVQLKLQPPNEPHTPHLHLFPPKKVLSEVSGRQRVLRCGRMAGRHMD